MFGRRKGPPKPPPPPCPLCGRTTSLGGRFCRGCGWDADTAEGDDAHLDGVSVPEAMDDDAYRDLLEDEGLAGAGPGTRRRPLVWWLAAVALLVAFALALIPAL